ncbi:LacI family DNA-binding transcriptional regulator [Paenibacillus woosongensis]|uniref:LacI family DNA-binding transcriptional regulator n=1 Tax=Paenibacillus woosongensis TaxID=307580 RepID=A0A7X3CNB5_9BACL|nr:LacI family DNA-binding transcriptional regulator [Paenibacillus woosongensis]MUG46090.1 LacI family DNA-binding transcriptional regulator [Paenibacillus woosongensis]WHX48116.1 LacI family DNA-binding transcriptional regulator [Paenibacillus woosongensis]
MSNISIKDIAARANVSTATVSYVLNGTRNVRPKTRERVLAVIEELNYKPNDIAKSLKRRRTDTIGVIAEDVTVFNTPEIIDGINDYGDRHDLHILLTNLRLDKRIGRDFDNVDKYKKYATSAVSELLSKQVDGIIYVGVHTRDLSGLIDTEGKPIVYTYGYTQNDIAIQYNDEQASYEAMSYLVQKGHRRIAIISGLMDSIPSRLRLNGYYKAVTEFELPFDPLYIKMGDWERESGYRLTKELLALPEPPTAILSMNDVMVVGVLEAANEAGVKVPADLSVIGFDNREFSDYLTPRITTMDIPLHEMGYQAMEVLHNLMQGKKNEPVNMPVCRLIERDSVAAPKK